MSDRLFPIKNVAENELLPFSIHAIRRLIYAKKIKTVDIGLGSVPRHAISENEIERINKKIHRGKKL